MYASFHCEEAIGRERAKIKCLVHRPHPITNILYNTQTDLPFHR